MSMDAARNRLPECVGCNEPVDENDAATPYRSINREYFHARCVVSSDYARTVHDLLTSGKSQTRPCNEHPLLSDAETDEMIEDFLLGVPAETFAAKLEARDIAVFEQSIDVETATPPKDVTAVTAAQQDRAPLNQF